MSVAFSKFIGFISRCARELLLTMYIVVPSAKAGVFSSFLPIAKRLISSFCLIFSNNISSSIINRITDNGYLCHSPLFTRKACDKCPFTLICLYVLINCFYCLYHGRCKSVMLQGFKEKIPVHPFKCFSLVKCYHCCLNLISVVWDITSRFSSSFSMIFLPFSVLVGAY